MQNQGQEENLSPYPGSTGYTFFAKKGCLIFNNFFFNVARKNLLKILLTYCPHHRHLPHYLLPCRHHHCSHFLLRIPLALPWPCLSLISLEHWYTQTGAQWNPHRSAKRYHIHIEKLIIRSYERSYGHNTYYAHMLS